MTSTICESNQIAPAPYSISVSTITEYNPPATNLDDCQTVILLMILLWMIALIMTSFKSSDFLTVHEIDTQQGDIDALKREVAALKRQLLMAQGHQSVVETDLEQAEDLLVCAAAKGGTPRN